MSKQAPQRCQFFFTAKALAALPPDPPARLHRARRQHAGAGPVRHQGRAQVVPLLLHS